MDIYISRATCGRIMAINRWVYGLKKPDGNAKAPKELPFQAQRRHQCWSTDIRYIAHSLPVTGNVYSISIMENYSRAILWSALTTRQDLGQGVHSDPSCPRRLPISTPTPLRGSSG